MVKNKIFYNVYKTDGTNEIKNKKCKLDEKNWSNDNIKINTFSYQNNFCKYEVPELKNNNSTNMIKKIEKFSKNNKINIKPIEENEGIKSDNRKFENDDYNEKDKSFYIENKKQEIIDLKASNNKEQFNCFHFNKMLNNMNNNNYNHNYNINSNNNVFNNINPINYNNEYLFNYISSKDSIKNVFNSKSLGKMKKISNRTTGRILNDKFKESIGFKTKMINICKRMKKNKNKKNIASFDNRKSYENNNSKEKIKTLLNDYKNSISRKNKIMQINLNKTDKFNKFRELPSSQDSSKKKNHFNNKSLKKMVIIVKYLIGKKSPNHFGIQAIITYILILIHQKIKSLYLKILQSKILKRILQIIYQSMQTNIKID